MPTLDYLYYPHIFSEIVAQSDFKTQNKLRLLSSSTKRDVDRHQCRNCAVYIGLWLSDGESDDEDEHESPTLTALKTYINYFPSFPILSVPMLMPFESGHGVVSLATGAGTTDPLAGERSVMEQLFAWSCKGNRGAIDIEALLWEQFLIANAEESATPGFPHPISCLEHIEGAASLILNHCEERSPSSWLGSEGGDDRKFPEQVTLPVSVQDLQVFFTTYPCLCRIEIHHTAQALKLAFPDYLRGTVCGLSVDLLKPCVQYLQLQVHQPDLATEYFKAVRCKPLHPDLRVVVISKNSRAYQEKGSIVSTWERLMGVQVELWLRERLSSFFDGVLSLDGW